MRSPLLCVCLAAFACGDPAAGDGLTGEPLGQIEVHLGGDDPRMDGASGVIPTTIRLRIALFWQVGGLDGDRFIEQPSSSVQPTDGPPLLVVRERPPASVLVGDRYAIGQVIAYDDANDNGRHDPDETVHGLLSNLAVTLALRDLAAGEGPTDRPLARGLYVHRAPLLCRTPRPTPTDADACGITAWSGCTGNADCGEGVCRGTGPEVDGEPLRVCQIPETSTTTCRPTAATFVPGFDGDASTLTGVYVAPCDTADDCDPREDCDPVVDACLARHPVLLRVFETPGAPPPLCVEDDQPSLARGMGPPRPD